MRNYNKTVRLKSDEYKSASTMKAFQVLGYLVTVYLLRKMEVTFQ